MGTKVQSKTYFPGSMRDVNNNLCNGMWDLYREDRTSANNEYYDPFLTRPTPDGYAGYAKQQMRQTILKQESMFKHQLQELHRLYRRQRDMMNELTRRELQNYQMPAETSKSSPYFGQPSENAKEICHISNFSPMDPSYGHVATSGANGIHSHVSFVKGKSTLKDCTPQRRMFDLEQPADEDENSEESRHVEKIHSSVLNSEYIGDPLGSTLHAKRGYNLADLNEPIQIEETSLSASVNYLNTTSCLKEELQRRDASANSNSGFWFSSKFSQNFLVERENGTYRGDSHLDSERHRKEQLTYSMKSGKTKCDEHAYFNSIHPDRLPKLSNSLQLEPKKVLNHLVFPVSDKIKAEPQRKRTIFGVEICERSQAPSLDASRTPSSHASNLQSDAMNSESSFALPSRKISSSLDQNALPLQGNHWLSSFNPSSGNPNSVRQIPEFLGGKICANSNSRLLSSSIDGSPYQKGSCIRSFLNGKQVNGWSSSISGGFSSGIHAKKSASSNFEHHGLSEKFDGIDCIDLTDENHLSRDHMSKNEASCQLNSVSSDGKKKHQNPEGGPLPWLIAKSPDSCMEQKKGKEILYQMNLDSLQNHSQQFFKKAEMPKVAPPSLLQDSTSLTCAQPKPDSRKVETDDWQSVTKILGFPIVDVLDISKDRRPPGCPFKTSDHAYSSSEGENIKKDHACDDEVGKDGEVSKDLVNKNGLNNYISDLRHHIDLNLSLNEEETPLTPSFPEAIVKIATTDIDLEAPAVMESDMEVETLEIEVELPSKLPSQDDSMDAQEELVKVAAEAIMAISISEPDNKSSSAPCQALDGDLLLWFAEVISADDLSAINDEEYIPHGMDHYEFMTLKLHESEEEYCHYEPIIYIENEIDEGGGTSLAKRPRKGQGRRGRQKKDFQRDILPSIISLSRREVTQDLQTFEEVFNAIGVSWQSSLSKRKAARSNRGRKRLADQPDTSPQAAIAQTVSPPTPVLQQQQQPVCREVALEEKSLSGWGKRTRRLPRQRCSNGNHTLALKC